jgi:hypothetical protein
MIRLHGATDPPLRSELALNKVNRDWSISLLCINIYNVLGSAS